MGKQFDDLSKAMASRISRGQALRGMVGGAFAAALAVLIPGRALASNDDGGCDEFCDAIYGEGTWQAHVCSVQASHGSGPCYQFGPGSLGCRYVDCPEGQFCVSVNVNHTQGRGFCYNNNN